jgi:hypothetical protein
MDLIGHKGNQIELLIDRHAELCECFSPKSRPSCRGAPVLISPNGGKSTAECLAALVDQALFVYEGSDCGQDPRIFALKIALTDTIVELTGVEGPGS